MFALMNDSALAVAAFALGAGMAQAESIRLGTEGAYAPFNSVSQSGELNGFDIDIGNAICAEMEVTCEWSTHEWGGIIPALTSGKFDVLIASMAITEARMEEVAFSDPYYFNTMRFAALEELGLEDATPETLDGMILGTQAGGVASKVLNQYFPNNEIKLYPKLGEAFLDMESGRLDLVLESKFALADWMADGVDCCEFVGKDFLLDGTIGAGMAFRKDETALRDRVNTALATIIENGTYDEIREKYFDFDIRSKPIAVSELFTK
ncbi:transporter substrate-binding domain-containing protein [Roseovarius nanhaiticus]|uniref:transporter substrate-binding domain-containing protein n=1 Tax=Roseovarius nanhaiticus TaxID=573024 RepID=UPI0024915756|nr:transporter substrate-binding domain-containing protein [Roseovarius nanhaiticus]